MTFWTLEAGLPDAILAVHISSLRGSLPIVLDFPQQQKKPSTMAWTKATPKYSALSDPQQRSFEDMSPTADDIALLETEKCGHEGPQRPRRGRSWTVGRLLTISSVLLLTVFNTASMFVILSRQWKGTCSCTDESSTPSPGLTQTGQRFQATKFNGTLDFPSIYRQDPSPEVDAAWDKLTDAPMFSVSEEELLATGQTTDSVRLPASMGGGYMVELEASHQLHCLNFLRKNIFLEYYQSRSVEFSGTDNMVHTHRMHCVEMLRQNLMCKADQGVIAYKWVRDYPRPYPDFNTWHQCRSWEATKGWVEQRRVRVDVDWEWKPEDGAVILETAP